MDKIYLAGPSITEHEISTVSDMMRTGWSNDNPYEYVEKFQKEFAGYHDRKYGIMTPCCTHAIHLLLLGLGIKNGDELIVPECTWVATAAPIIYLGGKPVFCDIEKDSWCLDPKSVEENITKKTKAIIVVDLYGNMPNMDKLTEISRRYNIPLIEDSAEALGSKYKNIRAGKFGIGSVFSFHRTKTITTGEGGMLLLDDEELYKKCMILRDHGRDIALPDNMRDHSKKQYFLEEITPKYMPSNLQASIGYSQFNRIDELVGKKRWIFSKYKEGLSEIDGIELNMDTNEVYNGVWATSMIIGEKYNTNKLDFIEKLSILGIPSRPFFYPLSSLPAFRGLINGDEVLKNKTSYDVSNRGITLPCDLKLNEEQINFICNGIKKIIN